MKIIKIILLLLIATMLFTFFALNTLNDCYKSSSLVLKQITTISKNEKWSKAKACNYAKKETQRVIACIDRANQKNTIGAKLRDIYLKLYANKNYTTPYIIETHNKNCPMHKL
jgi:hypothetical protein